MASHNSSSVHLIDENNMFPIYKKAPCNHIELAEYRTIKSGKKIQNHGDILLSQYSKEFKVTMSLCNSTILRFKQKQSKLLAKAAYCKICKDNKRAVDNKENLSASTTESAEDLEAELLTPSPELSADSEHQQLYEFERQKTTIEPEFKPRKPRSVTISLPIESHEMAEVGTGLSSSYHFVARPDRVKMPAGLPNLSLSEEHLPASMDVIPKAVLQRGRRMSRSASCMKDLVRQEISDYVDQKSKPLPKMIPASLQSTSQGSLHIPIIKNHGDSKAKLPLHIDINGNRLNQPIKSQLSTDSVVDSAAYTQYERSSSSLNREATQHTIDTKTSSNQSLSDNSDEDSGSRSSANSSPPLHPHPPSSKKDRHQSLLKRRHHKLVTVS